MFLNVVKYTRNKHKYKYWLINLSLVDSIFFNWIFDFEFRFSNDDDDDDDYDHETMKESSIDGRPSTTQIYFYLGEIK